MPIAAWGFAPALAAGNTVVAEAGRGDAAQRAAPRRARPRGGPARGRAPGRPRRGRRWRAGASSPSRAVRKVCFTGSSAVGKRVMARLCRAGEAGDARARRQERQRRLRRRRPRARGRACVPSAVFDNAGQDCCARSRLLVETSVFERFMELLEPAVKGVRASCDPTDPRSEMGPLISAPRSDRASSDLRRRRRRSRSGAAPPTAPASGTRRRCSRRSPTTQRVVQRGDLRPGGVGHALRRRGRGGRRSPTTAPTGSRDRSGRGTWRGRCGVARRIESGTLSVNSNTLGPLPHALRGLQAVRPRPRARTRRPARLQRGEERVHRDGGLMPDDSRARSP